MALGLFLPLRLCHQFDVHGGMWGYQTFALNLGGAADPAPPVPVVAKPLRPIASASRSPQGYPLQLFLTYCCEVHVSFGLMVFGKWRFEIRIRFFFIISAA